MSCAIDSFARPYQDDGAGAREAGACPTARCRRRLQQLQVHLQVGFQQKGVSIRPLQPNRGLKRLLETHRRAPNPASASAFLVSAMTCVSLTTQQGFEEAP
jgi:hypothetical protein